MNRIAIASAQSRWHRAQAGVLHHRVKGPGMGLGQIKEIAWQPGILRHFRVCLLCALNRQRR